MQFVFASNNKNKIKEVQLLVGDKFQILSLQDIGCIEDIPETASTIEGNAILKANYITEKFGYDCFADDSGLEIEVLNGAPGVYSARYAGSHRSDDDNMELVISNLKDQVNRKANFKTVIVLNLNGQQHTFTGIIDGILVDEKRGTNGFGYDPIFVANGFTKTFAELTLEEKATISHRGKAVKQLVEFLHK
jgi:XTP/dITP diphosphohydrolase